MKNGFLRYCLALLMVVGLFHGDAVGRSGADANLLSRIETAAASGRLAYETALLYKLRAVCAPEKLPYEFRAREGDAPIKCGTPIVMEAMQAAPSLSDAFRSELQESTQRVTTDSTYRSPAGWFLIHYDLDSVNAVSATDADSSGFPDFIENLAIYFDSSWAGQVSHLGWLAPPSDGAVGGDSLYDVYPLSLGPTYGITVQEAAGPEPWSDYSSYILVNRSFLGFPPNDDPDGNQKGSMKVTAAHEFNHACQFANNPLHLKVFESWWQEISATWIEDVVYDTTNDNYNFLDEFFPFPAISLYDGSDRKYGAFVFGKYLEENHGVDVVRDAWENMRWVDAYTALNTALASHGETFAGAFSGFAGWNYFTDTRDYGAHYEEGARYLMLPITRVDSVYPISNRGGASLQSMAADYIEFIPDGTGRDVVKLSINGASGARWAASLWKIDSSGTGTETIMEVDSLTGDGTIVFSAFDQLARALLVTSNVSALQTQKTYLYSLSFLAKADCDGDGGADIFDVLYLIDFVYNHGPQPVPVWQVGDLDCSGGIDILDMSIILDYVLKGGPTPCTAIQ